MSGLCITRAAQGALAAYFGCPHRIVLVRACQIIAIASHRQAIRHRPRMAGGASSGRRAIEANRNNPAHFNLAAALAQLGRLDEARSAVKAGLALNPTYTISRARAAWTAMSGEPTYLAQTERILEGMRKAGVPEQ